MVLSSEDSIIQTSVLLLFQGRGSWKPLTDTFDLSDTILSFTVEIHCGNMW
jgi:hypothetical protein